LFFAFIWVALGQTFFLNCAYISMSKGQDLIPVAQKAKSKI